MNKNILKKCQKIKILLTDVDGVLTDGGMYYTKDGDVMKKFYVGDGMGINLLLRRNIHTIIVTKEKNQVTRNWANRMNVKKIYDGIKQKEAILEKILINFKVKTFEVCYIGDDINDVKLMKKVGLSACPKNANRLAINTADYICNADGGKGALREVADMILYAKYPNEKNFYDEGED